MSLAISALGFWIYTRNKAASWSGLKQLGLARDYSALLIRGLRPFLAQRTFLKALQRRDRLSLSTRRKDENECD